MDKYGIVLDMASFAAGKTLQQAAGNALDVR
jgi:hypothetical protein